jgi:ribonuclease HI
VSGQLAAVVWDDLAAVAFHKEKTAARRLAARIGVTLGAALHQVLVAAALPSSIAELVTERQHEVARLSARRTCRMQQQAEVRQRKQVTPCQSLGQWHAWFDGSASPNPGHIGIGAVLLSPQGKFADISQAGGIGDSSEAEYLALIAVLELAVTQKVETLLVFGDSRIVIDDIIGVHLVAALAEYRRQAQHLQRCIGSITFCWIPRVKNARADCLARRRGK